MAHRLIGADFYIQQEATGTPEEFASKLDVCESHLYQIIDTLKQMGGPIAYSRRRRTYYYKQPKAFLLGYYDKPKLIM